MDNYNEREFSIGDVMMLNLMRNDFEDLGSVVEISIEHLKSTSHIISMSFYTEEMVQVNQKKLLLLCNYENVLFDNVLMLSSFNRKDNSEYKIKLLNKEIKYMKIYINCKAGNKGSNYDFSNVFDIKGMKILTEEEIKEINFTINKDNDLSKITKEKNDNLNLILSELDKVNQSLIIEKEKIDKAKQFVIDKEDKISKMIVKFKEEMILLGNKYYGECVNEINARLLETNKKMQNCENNVLNKYRIIKEKIKNDSLRPNTTNTTTTTGNKDKIANLEIKLKFLDDANNSLKAKITEKDEKIKQLQTNEEKTTKTIKKLKDDIVLMKSQLKDKSQTTTATVTSKPETSLQTSSLVSKSSITTKKKTILSYEINKTQIENFDKVFIKTLTQFDLTNIQAQTEKQTSLFALLLMNVITNPINLYNKYDYGHIILAMEFMNIFVSGNFSQFYSITNLINEYINKFPDFKQNVLTYYKNLKEEPNVQFKSIVNIIVGFDNKQQNINDTILSRGNSFDVFITNKEQNSINKLTTISNLLIMLFLANNGNDVICVMTSIAQRYLYPKDDLGIKFLIKVNYLSLVKKFYDRIDYSLIQDYVQCLIDTVLIFSTYNYLLSTDDLMRLLNNENVCKYMREKLNDEEDQRTRIKVIMLLSTLSLMYQEEVKGIIKEKFSNEISGIKLSSQIPNKKLINKNLNLLKQNIN